MPNPFDVMRGPPKPRGPIGYNPFLDPAREGTLGGAIGGMLGRPTRADAASQAQGIALQSLSQRIQGGMPANRALIEFLSSPEGLDYFVSDPDGLKNLGTFMNSQLPQAAAPGTAMIGPDGNIVTQVPTDDMMDFEHLADVAAVDPPTKAALAEAALLNWVQGQGGTVTSTEKERAFGRLVSQGLIDPQNKDYFLAGLIETKPLQNAAGDTIGYIMFNTQTGESKTFSAKEGAAEAFPGVPVPPGEQGQVPGQTSGAPGAVAPAGAEVPGQDAGNVLYDEGFLGVPQGYEVPADVARGAGIDPWLKKVFGGIYGQFFRGFTGKDEASRRNALSLIKQQAQTLRATGRLAADQTALNSIVDTLDIGTSDIQAAQMLLDFRRGMERAAMVELGLQHRPGTSEAGIKDSEALYNDIIRALAHVPPAPALEALIAKMEKEPRGPAAKSLLGAGEALGTVEEDTLRLLGNEPREFASEKDVMDAFNKGELQYGDDVIVNGQVMTLQKPE